MATLPGNITTADDARMIGVAGLAYLGEAGETPKIYVADGNGNSISVYSDGSLWLCVNVSEIYPSVGDFLMECGDNETELTRQLKLALSQLQQQVTA
jgi:hypothetical protein